MNSSALSPKQVLVGLSLVIVLCVSGCGRNAGTDQSTPEKTGARNASVARQTATRDPNLKVDPKLIAMTNDFGFRLYHQIARKGAEKNLFISPASVEVALAMTYNGARADTKKGMAKALGIGAMPLDDFNRANAGLLELLRNPDPKVQLSTANSLWGRKHMTFLKDFLERNRKYYGANIESIDFDHPSSVDTINAWVRDNTGGMIKKTVDREDMAGAFLILVNAIYFEGKWTLPFDPRRTEGADFTLLDGAKKKLPMMNNTGAFSYLENDQFQAIALPYGDKFVQAYVFLPKPNVKLADFMASLTSRKWTDWTTKFKQRPGTIVLPRFKAGYSSNLKGSLSAMGMAKAFSDQEADFMGMITDAEVGVLGERPYIDKVIHKTALEVYEEGTKASAVTVVVMGPGGAAPESSVVPFMMTVDHPFLFAICDRHTGAILFLGTIVDPEPLGR